MYRITRAFLILGLVLGAGTVTVWAGSQARIRGKVTDSKGSQVKGAKITLTTKAITGFKKEYEADDDGTFSFVILDATHRYLFHIEAPDYVPYEEWVKVPVGAMNFEKTFKLKTRAEMEQREQEKLLEQPGYKEFEAGRAALEAGDKATATAQFEAAVKAKPDLGSAWAALARLRFDDGDMKGSYEAAKACLEQDPDSVPCLAVAVNASKELGDEAAHEKYLSHYQELNPEDPATIFNQAAEFLNKMDDEHAKPLLEQCLQLDPDYPKCLFEYGMLMLRTGDMAGAKKTLQHYLEVAPDGPDAAVAKDTLKYL